MIDEPSTTGLSNTVRCAIYTRTACDHMRSTSLEDQERICRTAAGRHPGWVVPVGHIYCDKGVSGNTLAGRDGLDSLLADASKTPRPFDCLLTEDLARISRSLSLVHQIINTLALHGVSVHFVATGLNSGDPAF